MTLEKRRQCRWYFGGLGSALAVLVTHPLDLTKVHLQTQQKPEFGFIRMGFNVVKRNGPLALYNGISASIARHIFYSFPRFGIYEIYKSHRVKDGSINIHEEIIVSGFAGMIGGVMGNPFDVINVRMQNDMKLKPDKRRNYKHVVDGFFRIVKHEGFKSIFNGVTMNTSRAVLMTIGQGAGYDQCKRLLMKTGIMGDSPPTHFMAGIGAAMFATLLANPFDVLKIRMMNAPPGKYDGIMACAKDVTNAGKMAFYKGLLPAYIKIGPQTVLLHMIKEQLTEHFGYLPD